MVDNETVTAVAAGVISIRLDIVILAAIHLLAFGLRRRIVSRISKAPTVPATWQAVPVRTLPVRPTTPPSNAPSYLRLKETPR